MHLSKTFVKTQKDISSEEKSINAQLLIKWWFINQLMAWVYTYLPMWWRVLKKIENIIREEMNKIWWEEVFMPSLQPKENWEATGRWDWLDVLFRFTTHYTKREIALWATHEEVVGPLLKNYILSYKDLPRYVYQIQNKFRDEVRAKSWILRSREFLMKDLYSFHSSQEDLDEYYEKAIVAYNNIFERVWIKNETYKTYASWWTFCKYSHEFQTVTEAWEDLISVCEKCHIAINKEIIEDQPNCPECGSSDLKQIKAVETWNIFKLWTKYSIPFDITFTDENNVKKQVIMWCYGIGLWRLLGTVVEVLHDDKGIIWPESIAPYKYVIIPIWEKGSEVGEQIYNYLLSKSQEVAIDDRDVSAWYKFKDADLIWYPFQIVVSEKTLANGENMVELVDRKTGDKKLIKYTDLL